MERDFLDRIGDLERDFLDTDLLLVSVADDVLLVSGEGERLFFFLPSAILINFACSLDIATAASLLTKIKEINYLKNKIFSYKYYVEVNTSILFTIISLKK